MVSSLEDDSEETGWKMKADKKAKENRAFKKKKSLMMISVLHDLKLTYNNSVSKSRNKIE